jgi:hypothetical protein
MNTGSLCNGLAALGRLAPFRNNPGPNQVVEIVKILRECIVNCPVAKGESDIQATVSHCRARVSAF